MRGMLVMMMAAAGLLLAGCGVKSVDPWLGEETIVTDDRLAGVWQGDCGLVGSEPPVMNEIVIATVHRIRDEPLEEQPFDDESAGAAETGAEAAEATEAAEAMLGADGAATEDSAAEAPPEPVVYRVIYYSGDNLHGWLKAGQPGSLPTHYFATLHEIDGTLLLQLCGQVEEGERMQLVRTLYMLFKADLVESELRLYPMSTEEGQQARVLLESGLQLRHEGEGNYLVISPTEELEAFVRLHLADPLFFDDQPSIILRRVGDLRAPADPAVLLSAAGSSRLP